jgi:hypothetical protein
VFPGVTGLFLVLVLCTQGLSAQQSDTRWLIGTWEGDLQDFSARGGQGPAGRVIRITAAAPDGTAQGKMGVAGKTLNRAELTFDGSGLRIVNSSASVLKLKRNGDGHLVGTLTAKSGKVFEILLTRTNDSGDERITVIYVSALNCPFCRDWEANSKTKWEQSAERSRVDFRVVQAPFFERLDEDHYWSSDIRWIRDQLRISRGTPRFIVVVDGKVVRHKFGVRSWQTEIYPLLQSLLSTKTD